MKFQIIFCLIIYLTLNISCKDKINASTKDIASISGKINYSYFDGINSLHEEFNFINSDTINEIITLINKSELIKSQVKGSFADIRLFINYKNNSKICLLIYIRPDKTATIYLHNRCNEGFLIGQYRNEELALFFNDFMLSKGLNLFNMP